VGFRVSWSAQGLGGVALPKKWGWVMGKYFVFPKFVFSLFLCLAVLLVCTSPVWAQSGTTGALTGVVTDPSGGVISGATVTLTNTGTGQTRTATTDASGNYKFSQIPPGTYSLKFEASGFKPPQSRRLP